MSTAQQALVDAEGALERARDDARRAAVEDTRKQLEEIRATAKRLKAELAAIAVEVNEYNMTVAKLRGELDGINSAIAQLSAPSADPLNDPADREEELAELRTCHQEVVEQIKAAERLDARRVRGIEITNALPRLQSTAANLLNVIEHGGRFVAGPEGGVYGVR